MLTRRIIAVLMLLMPITAAQEGQPNLDDGVRRIATHTFTLSAASGVLAINVPALTNKPVYLVEAAIECSASCSFNQTLNGTISGGSTVTGVVLNTSGSPTALATVYQGATVTGGSALPTWTVPVTGQPWPVALTHIVFKRSSAAQSYAISTGSMTGTAKIALIYIEKN